MYATIYAKEKWKPVFTKDLPVKTPSSTSSIVQKKKTKHESEVT